MTFELDLEIKQLEKELEMLQLGEEGNKQNQAHQAHGQEIDNVNYEWLVI